MKESFEMSIAEAANDLNIYPNPAASYIRAQYRTADEPTWIQITDVLGRKIISNTLPPNYSDHLVEVGTLAPGEYLLDVFVGQIRVATGIFSKE